MKPSNPFLISGYYGPEYFCDRQKETSAVLEALHNGRNLTLTAPRRIGKTGLIHHAFHCLRERSPEVVAFYIDIYATQSLGDLVKLLANTVLGQLDSVPQKAFNRVRQFIRSCRPVLTFDGFSGTPSVTIDVEPAEEAGTLKEIFEYLGSSERRCYLAIDEFQQIAEYPEKGVEALLRSYIQFLPNVNFIFAGSKQHVMQEMFASSKRPFYQSTQLLTLGNIDREAYYQFAARHFANRGTRLQPETFDAIYGQFEGHTWYVQCLLNRLYGYGREESTAAVDYAIGEIVEEQSYSYTALLRAYPASNVHLLKAIAREGCVKEPLSGQFVARHHLRAASSVSAALKKLLDGELVYRTDAGYVVYDRFMARWLRQQPF